MKGFVFVLETDFWVKVFSLAAKTSLAVKTTLAVKTSLAKMTASILAKEFYVAVVGYDVILSRRHV